MPLFSTLVYKEEEYTKITCDKSNNRYQKYRHAYTHVYAHKHTYKDTFEQGPCKELKLQNKQWIVVQDHTIQLKYINMNTLTCTFDFNPKNTRLINMTFLMFSTQVLFYSFPFSFYFLFLLDYSIGL